MTQNTVNQNIRTTAKKTIKPVPMMKFAFFKGKGSVYDYAIRKWENGPYSHCEAILSGPNEKGEYETASSLPGVGVRITTQALPDSDWDFVESPGNVKAVRQWYRVHSGAGYDYLGIAGFVFRPVPAEKGVYFCSESMGNALGIPEAWRYDPNALASLLRYKAAV